MKFKILYLSIVLLVLFNLTIVKAQDAITVSGGNAIGNGGGVSYSVGQIFCNSYTDTGGSVSQGVQQPYEIWDVTWINEANSNGIILSVSPNPTSDFVILKINDEELLDLSFHLYDNNGKLIEHEKLIETEAIINMIDFSSSTYYLKVTDGIKVLKTFKIIKN